MVWIWLLTCLTGVGSPATQLDLDSLNMRQVGRWFRGPVRAIAVDSARNLALISSGARLLVLDLTDSIHPQIVGALDIPEGIVRSIHYDPVAQRAYLAASDVVMVDLQTPSAPARMGRIATPGTAQDVSVHGNTLYVADGNAGLRVYDITQPANPVERGSLVLSYTGDRDAREVAVVGTVAYVGLGSVGCLFVVDVSNPASPVNLGRPYSSNCAVNEIIPGGNVLYVAADGELLIWDITQPSSPLFKNRWSNGYALRALAVKDTLLMAGSGNDTLLFLDVHDPSFPFQISSVTLPAGAMLDWPVDLAVRGSVLFVAGRMQGLRVVDIADPQQPVVVNQVTGVQATRMVDRDTLLFVSAFGGSVRSFSIARPPGIQALGSLSLSSVSRPLELAQVGSTLVLGDNDLWFRGPALGFVDATDPAAMVDLGRDTSDLAWQRILGMDVNGQLLYVVTGNGSLLIKDVSSPPSSVTLSVTPGASRIFLGRLSHWSSVLYRVTENGQGIMEIFDVSNPSHPVLVRRETVATQPLEVVADSPYLYVVDTAGLYVMDIQNLTAPVKVGSVRVSLGFSLEVDAKRVGSVLYVAMGHNRLLTFDVSDPLHPGLLVDYQDPSGGNITGTVVRGRYVYVSEHNAGLKVLTNLTRVPGTPPHEIGDLDTPDGLVAVARYRRYAVAADPAGTLRVLDLGTLPDPVEKGQMALSSVADLKTDSTYVLAAVRRPDTTSGVRVIDLSRPGQPTLVGSLNLGSWTSEIERYGDLAYVAQNTNLRVVDLSQSTHPALLNTLRFLDGVISMTVDSPALFVGLCQRVVRTHIQNPTQPTIVDTFSFPISTCGNTQVAALTPKQVAVATEDGWFRVVQFHDTSGIHPTVVGSLQTPGSVRDILYIPPYVFLAMAEGGVRALDVSIPAQPQQVGYYIPPGTALKMAQYGNDLLIASGEAGLTVVEVLFATGVSHPRTPATPPEVAPLQLDVPLAHHKNLELRLNRSPSGGIIIRLWDVLGRSVRRWERAPEKRRIRYVLPAQDLPGGWYLLEVRTEGKRWRFPVLYMP